MLAVAIALAVGLTGVTAAPALAGPREERQAIAVMKDGWADLSPKEQRTICKAYRIAPRLLIRESVSRSLDEPGARDLLNRAAWTRVITAYLEWACAGSGTTPR
jgi:hypothetical protein